MTKKKPTKHPHRGQRVDDWLKEEGIYEAATQRAIKEVIAWQLSDAMEKAGIGKVEMALRMKTSRGQLNRVLDPLRTG